MLVTIDEAKDFLRVDTEADDALIEKLIDEAEHICMDITRSKDKETFEYLEGPVKAAVLYTTAYLYEHREEADYHELMIMLRSLLFGVRRVIF